MDLRHGSDVVSSFVRRHLPCVAFIKIQNGCGVRIGSGTGGEEDAGADGDTVLRLLRVDGCSRAGE